MNREVPAFCFHLIQAQSVQTVPISAAANTNRPVSSIFFFLSVFLLPCARMNDAQDAPRKTNAIRIVRFSAKTHTAALP